MSATTELARRVTTLLQTKADQVTIDDEPFDPHRPAFVDVDLVDPDGDGDVRTTGRHVHPRRRLLLAVAGATLLVGLAVTLRAARHSDEPAVTATATSTSPTTDDTEATDGPHRANLVDGPPIASVQLSSATLELHDDGAAETLCVRPAGGDDLGCGTGLTASVVVDGTWYVAVAQNQGAAAPLVAPGWGDPPYRGDPAMPSLDEQALPTETASDAGWSFTLATPPRGVDLVWLEQGLTHIELDRPTTPPAG